MWYNGRPLTDASAVNREKLNSHIFYFSKANAEARPLFPEIDFTKNFCYNNYRKIKKGEIPGVY